MDHLCLEIEPWNAEAITAHLAAHADVEMLAVTLAGTGESDCEPGVRNTRALLAIAGWPSASIFNP